MIIPNSTYVVPEAFIAVLRRHIKEDMPHALVGKDNQRQLAPWKTNTRHVLDVRVMDNGKVKDIPNARLMLQEATFAPFFFDKEDPRCAACVLTWGRLVGPGELGHMVSLRFRIYLNENTHSNAYLNFL